jgi:hypothetical protein
VSFALSKSSIAEVEALKQREAAIKLTEIHKKAGAKSSLTSMTPRRSGF